MLVLNGTVSSSLSTLRNADSWATYVGPRLRKLKKAYVSALSPQSANRYLPIQLAESTQLLHDMAHDPDVSPILYRSDHQNIF